MDFFKLFKKRGMKKIKCPACHNDATLKKKCIVCRGTGQVWKE